LTKAEQRSWAPPESSRSADTRLADLWCSPNIQGELRVESNQLRCAESGETFLVTDGIPQLVWPRSELKSTSNSTPTGSGDEQIDSVRSLIEQMRGDEFARRLDESIPYNTDVLEVGCGTGNLANFLGVSCRRVIGTDSSLDSLRQAERFRREHALHRVRFVQMNLHQPCFRAEAFDVVVCTMLHHTADPRGGCASLARLVRPGGYIVLGLYNRMARIVPGMRRALAAGRRPRPQHESTHTIGEVLEWFRDSELSFVSADPPRTTEENRMERGSLFEPASTSWTLDHFLAQARQLLTGSRHDGMFHMIAQKPRDARKHQSEAPAREPLATVST
jgi:2-polyprenyl-3-methyl-5-hydroxy-6-metoxy-1,4-benzoquinol methylase